MMLAELIPTLDRLINDDLKDSMSIDGSQLRVSLAGKAAKKLVLEVRFNGTQPSRDQQYQYTTDAMRQWDGGNRGPLRALYDVIRSPYASLVTLSAWRKV